MTVRERERERERERRDRQTNRQTESARERERQTDQETDRDKQRQTDRKTDRNRDRDRDRETDHLRVSQLSVFNAQPAGTVTSRGLSPETGTAEEKESKQHRERWLLFVGCLTSHQQASVSQGRICSDNLTCCHTEIEVADPTFYLTQSQYTDAGPTSPSADPITPGAW